MMDAGLAFGSTDIALPRQLSWRGSERSGSFSTPTSTFSIVEAPPPSAAAVSTDQANPSYETATTTWLRPVVKRLNHLLQLQNGWDGPESLGIDVAVAVKALEFLARIAAQKPRPPSVAPGQDGSLQLAWYTREFELEIDIPRSGDPTASLYEHDSERESELTLASPQLYDAIGRLAAE
jgi:hypothetical protein